MIKLNIGAIIRTARKELNLTQLEFSKMVGISNTFLSDIENGRTNPSIGTLSKIIGVLHELGYVIDINLFLANVYVNTEKDNNDLEVI